MSRSLIIAILTFSSLIIINLAVFGFLSFGDLSKSMVQEKLVEGLQEAQAMVDAKAREKGALDSRTFSREIAPQLQRFEFFSAVVVLDSKGKVIHREVLQGQGTAVRRNQTGQLGNTSEKSDQPDASPPPEDARQGILQPLGAPPANQDVRLALEYDRQAIEREAGVLRQELNRKLWIAVLLSLLLLSTGMIYVISTFRRNQRLLEQTRKADRLANLGTLASGLAHEIRNPLNSMNMNVQLIQEEMEESGQGMTDDVRDMFVGTRKEIQRLERLVSSFLAYARPTKLQTQAINLNDLVVSISEFLAQEADKLGVRIELKCAQDLPNVQADENQLRQAFLNVIQNGLQVSPRGGTLELRTRKAAGDKVLVEIQDRGPGIAPQELENIFRAFYSTKRGGTGLGLPIAQRIAELHNGGIKVDSQVGRGTTFTFILPMEESTP